MPGVPPPPEQPQQPQRSCARTLGIALVIVVVLIVLARACGGGGEAGRGGSTTSSESETKEKAQKEAAPQQEENEDPNPSFRDGTQQVGSDIEAGTYRTRAASPGCYYARLSGFGGELESILANDNADDPAIVTIEPTDAGFESRRCGTWTQDLSRITDSTTSFEDGTYIVGTDIEPGTYRSSGGVGCYYARLSGFHGGLEDLITNGNADAPVVVEIGATDAGFQSKRCGSWEKVE